MHVTVHGDGRLDVSSGDDVQTWAFNDRDEGVLHDALWWCEAHGKVPGPQIKKIVRCIRACSELNRALRDLDVTGYWLEMNDGLVMYRWTNYDVDQYEDSGEVIFTTPRTAAQERAGR